MMDDKRVEVLPLDEFNVLLRHQDTEDKLYAAYETALSALAAAQERERSYRDALIDARDEIVYWHGKMLDKVERNHPRGSGWARVVDKIDAALTKGEHDGR
jgi:protein-tyrosine phosphatase